MNVFGVIPGAKNFIASLVTGDEKNPVIDLKFQKKIPLPDNLDQGKSLLDVKEMVKLIFEEHKIDTVAILQAGQSQYGGPSTTRVKIEAIFQIAAAESGKKSLLIHPNALNSKEKKFQKLFGKSLESYFNNGSDFKPKYIRKAVVVGWIGHINE